MFWSLKWVQHRIDFLLAIYAGVYVQCCVCKTDANIAATGNIAQTSKPGIGSRVARTFPNEQAIK